MKVITRKNYTIKNPKYIVFDIIKKSEFEAGEGKTPFSQRIKTLEELDINSLGTFVSIVPHENNISEEKFKEWKEKVAINEWEGLMLRDMNSFYTAKRSYDIQKVKSFYDNEYKVIGLELGKKKMLVNGIMVERECVKSIEIEHKGTKVYVGSGISDSQRIEWFKDPNLIMGKIVTVQYFEESIDSKTNQLSLRFPTLKIVHGEERQV